MGVDLEHFAWNCEMLTVQRDELVPPPRPVTKIANLSVGAWWSPVLACDIMGVLLRLLQD